MSLPKPELHTYFDEEEGVRLYYSCEQMAFDMDGDACLVLRLNASNVAQSDIFDKVIIQGNRFIYSDTSDRADFNVRIANAVTDVVISNNIFTDHSGSGDGLVYDTTTSGTVYGTSTTLNNIGI